VSGRSVGTHVNTLKISASTAASVLNGTVDEVAIYTLALSGQQVAEHYAAGRR
jgi:hypothetical protein